jgi:dihydroxyacetone kinase
MLLVVFGGGSDNVLVSRSKERKGSWIVSAKLAVLKVFTSPSPDQMGAATSTVDGGAGVLHIVKNYTGDVIVELGSPRARARPVKRRSARDPCSEPAAAIRKAASVQRALWRRANL